MLEEWRDGFWQCAEFTLWDVSHYNDGREYAAQEQAAILKGCVALMMWCVLYILQNLCAETHGILQVERANCKTKLFGC